MMVPRLLFVAAMLGCCAWARAAGDPEIDDLVREIERLPPQAFEQDPQGWQEVLELLENYAASQAGSPKAAPRRAAAANGAAGMTAAQQRDAFGQLLAGVRELPVSDLASLMVSAGLAQVDPPRGPNEAIDPRASVQLARWAESARNVPAGAPSFAVLPLFQPDTLRLLARRVELANAGQPRAASLNDTMQASIATLSRRADEESRTLLDLRRAGQASAQRLGALDGLMQAATSVPLSDAAESAQLAALRGTLAGVQAQQTQALMQLGGPDFSGGAAPMSMPRSALASRAAASALADDLKRRIAAGQVVGDEPQRQAAQLGRDTLALALLDVLAREESVKDAALRYGRQLQAQLLQTGAEMRRLADAVERAPGHAAL
ncbi:hypothetical protein [Rhizobacter sp. OV335]|uniref:hypothetical protein n=1 Tax=Rhizobacter sp. OV335 TaxID=1500264 RepID=UPI001F1D7C74|nr:hypothetical protein [Rhizobacter sp. OV335]